MTDVPLLIDNCERNKNSKYLKLTAMGAIPGKNKKIMNEISQSIYGELNEIPSWYALSTKARHEKKVYERLLLKKVESYLPLQTINKKWSDRYKIVEEPLFSCYIFVKMALKNRVQILQTDGVVRLVNFNGIPATIPESQLNAIRLLLKQKKEIQRISYLTPGQKVEVTQGPLKGVNGVLVNVKNKHRLVLRLDSIMQAISVDIDHRDIKVVE